jgi:type I restriction enzyme, S subunit
MTKVLRLGEFAEVGAGNSAPQNEALFKGGTLPFVRTSDVGAIHIGRIESSRDLLTPEGAKGLKLFPAGTVLFPKSGASTFLNHRVILGSSAYVSSHLATIKVSNDLALDRFIFYFLQTIDARDLCQDQAYPSLNRDQIAGIKVPLPSLDEQLRIVEQLDGAFFEIDSLEATLELCGEKTNQLLQSLLSSSFSHSSANDEVGVKVVLLKDICLEVPRLDPKSLGRDTFKYLDIGALSSNSRSIGDVNTVAVADAPGRARQLLSKNDCVFSTVRPYMKKIAYIDESLDNEIASTGFCVLRPDSKLVEPRFLYHYLYSDILLEQVLPLQTGVSYPAIRDGDLKGASIALPALEQQAKIVKKLDNAFTEIESLRAQFELKRNHATMLRQSILSSAFAEEKVVA